MKNADSSPLVINTIMLAAAMLLIVIGTLADLGMPSYVLIVAGILLAIVATIRYVIMMQRRTDQN